MKRTVWSVPWKKRAVRRHGEIEPGNRGEHRDELLDLAAEERLAAGEADLLDSVGREEARQPKRQVYSCPSGESRARVQSPQKGWVTEAITPISPPPSL